VASGNSYSGKYSDNNRSQTSKYSKVCARRSQEFISAKKGSRHNNSKSPDYSPIGKSKGSSARQAKKQKVSTSKIHVVSSGTTLDGMYHDTTDAEERPSSKRDCPLRLKRESTTKHMIDD